MRNTRTVIRARQLRIAVVKNLIGQGFFTEDDAKEVLAGNLSPNDDSTFVDDSHLVGNPNALEIIESEWDGTDE